MEVVTGAAGFIGSHLVDALLAQGLSVVGIDNLSIGRLSNLAGALQNANFRFVCGDIRNPLTLDDVMDEARRVFHLAALADIVPSIDRPYDYFSTNVDGTFALLEASRKAGISRFIYAASSSCYGLAQKHPTPETAPIQPEYPYALTKRLGEELVLHWNQVYQLPCVSLRFFNVYGPRARTNGSYGAVFGVFLAQKRADMPFTVVGDGTQTRDFTYVADVVAALIRAADSDVCGESINIGSGNTYSIKYLISLLGGDVVYIPQRPREPDCTFADIQKAKQLLHWSALTSFDDGVRSMLEHLDEFADAPVWTPENIERATSSWFQYLLPVRQPA